MISIFSINENIIHNGLKGRMLALSLVLCIKTTYLYPTSGKWLIVVNKE